MPYRTFNLEETARYLRLESSDIEQMVKRREIPFERHGERLVFRKVELDSWASPLILGLQGRRLVEYHDKASRAVEASSRTAALLPALVRPEFIEPALRAKTKASVLREMAALAQRTGRVWDPAELLAGLEAREALCSTGLPGGLALLHTRQPESYLFESAFLVLGRTVQEVPFGAPDGQGTDLFFLLACPESPLHLQTLARLCLIAQKTEVLTGLRQGQSAEQMHEVLLGSEREVLERMQRAP